MNGTQIPGGNFFNDISRPKRVHAEAPPSHTTGFMHPDEVTADLWLTPAEKREVLASWASDAHAVADAPALRQLGNGAIVRVDDILQALKCLDDDQDPGRTVSGPFRPFAGPRFRLPTRLNSILRRGWSDDDDDPPPCPAMIARPFGGPLSGGEAADPGLAMAA